MDIQKLIADAAEAQEIFGDDELEAHQQKLLDCAKELWNEKDKQTRLRGLDGFINFLRFKGSFNYPDVYRLFHRAVGVDLPEFDEVLGELDELPSQ